MENEAAQTAFDKRFALIAREIMNDLPHDEKLPGSHIWGRLADWFVAFGKNASNPRCG